MQFLDILNILPSLYLKILYLLLLINVSLWVYIDAERRRYTGWLWGLAIFLYPIILPLYFIFRPKKYFIEFCRKCFRIKPADSEDCYYCTLGITSEKESPSFPLKGTIKLYLYHFFLVFLRSYFQLAGFYSFFFEKKFLSLNFKLSLFYPLGRAHQIVITEGSKLNIPVKSLTYGETPFSSAAKIFSLAEMGEDDIFYDLGSGTGNIVFLANILYDIEATGIEILPSFIEYSNKIKKSLYLEKVSFIEGDFLEEDLSRGTVFFLVATLIEPILMKKIAKKLKKSPVGTKIITVTRKFKASHLKVKTSEKVFFFWGYDDVYVHERV